MSKMIIKVEFVADTDISDAITEAKEKAGLWGIAFVEFYFNGIKILVSENTIVENANNNYRRELNEKFLSERISAEKRRSTGTIL